MDISGKHGGIDKKKSDQMTQRIREGLVRGEQMVFEAENQWLMIP